MTYFRRGRVMGRSPTTINSNKNSAWMGSFTWNVIGCHKIFVGIHDSILFRSDPSLYLGVYMCFLSASSLLLVYPFKQTIPASFACYSNLSFIFIMSCLRQHYVGCEFDTLMQRTAVMTVLKNCLYSLSTCIKCKTCGALYPHAWYVLLRYLST